MTVLKYYWDIFLNRTSKHDEKWVSDPGFTYDASENPKSWAHGIPNYVPMNYDYYYQGLGVESL